MPLVSVVIPTLGRPKLLARALGGVQTQSLVDLEVIVVVDGPDPETVSYVQGVGDPRVRLVQHQHSLGPGKARDTGAEAALGAWVAFLDDDDEWLPDKLEKQHALAQKHPSALITTLSQVVTPGGSFIRPLRPYTPDKTIDEWLFDRTTWLKGGDAFLQTSSLMVPRELFGKLRFGTSRQHEDWEFVIRAVKEHKRDLLTASEVLTIHYDDLRPSLSKQRTWRQSLEWIESMGSLITRKGYSGFLLNEIGRATAQTGDYGALPALLARSFRFGRPTARQLFRIAVTWIMPTRWLKRLRKIV